MLQNLRPQVRPGERLRALQWERAFNQTFLLHLGDPDHREVRAAHIPAQGAGKLRGQDCAVSLWHGELTAEPFPLPQPRLQRVGCSAVPCHDSIICRTRKGSRI